MYNYLENFILYTTACVAPISMYYYLHLTNTEEIKKDKSVVKEFIESSDKYDFFNDIHKICGIDGKNNCLLSYNLTMSAYEKIKKDGLEKFLDHLVQYPKSFQNENGDYVWLYLNHEDEEESKKGNLYFLYTPLSFINEKYVSATMADLDESCGKNKCPHLEIMASIKRISDKAYPKGGFTEYEWFDISTKEMIIKRSFCIKIDEVEYKGKKRTLYMGSGHTKGNKVKHIDYTNMTISLINIFIVIGLFYLFGFLNYVHFFTKASALIGCVVILTINLALNAYKTEYTVDGYIENIKRINRSGLVLEAIIISSIIFIRLFKIRLQDLLYNVMIVSFGFLMYSSLSYSSDNVDNLKLQLLLKQLSYANGAILLILGFVFAVIFKKK